MCDNVLVCLCACMFLCVCVYMYVCVFFCVCMCVCVCMSVCLSLCVYVCVCVCMSVCLFLCLLAYECESLLAVPACLKLCHALTCLKKTPFRGSMLRKKVASPKAKGGYKQRLAAAASARPPSKLVEWLLKQHCWGGLPAKALQEVCEAARSDGLSIQMS